jgi:hypothetical protein
MMKLLDPRRHGYLDYAAVLALFISPTLFHFGDEPTRISYTIGFIQLVLSLATAYPLGMIKAVPFTVHGWIEFATSLILIALPKMADFTLDLPASRFFALSGLVLFGLWAATDYRIEAAGEGWAAHHGLTHR